MLTASCQLHSCDNLPLRSKRSSPDRLERHGEHIQRNSRDIAMKIGITQVRAPYAREPFERMNRHCWRAVSKLPCVLKEIVNIIKPGLRAKTIRESTRREQSKKHQGTLQRLSPSLRTGVTSPHRLARAISQCKTASRLVSSLALIP